MKVSVALCTYNGELYIEEQLISILTQSHQVDEIVVCDDCSTDATIQIVRKIAQEHPTVSFNIKVNNSNLGYIKNFEQAIRLCSGDIIFLSDQDDIWMAEKVAVMTRYLNQHNNIDVVFTNGELVDSNGMSLNGTLFDCVGFDKKGLKRWKIIRNRIIILACENRATGATIALRKSALSYLLPFSLDDAIIHDGQIALKAADKNKLDLINLQLIKYRTHDKQEKGILAWLHNAPNTEIIRTRKVRTEVCAYLSDTDNINKIKFITYRQQLVKQSYWRIVCAISSYIAFYKWDFLLCMAADIYKKIKS